MKVKAEKKMNKNFKQEKRIKMVCMRSYERFGSLHVVRCCLAIRVGQWEEVWTLAWGVAKRVCDIS